MMEELSGNHWQDVNTLLDEALARPEGERAAFVEHICADDATLCREVQSLLEAHEKADGFFTGLAQEFVEPASSALEAEAEERAEPAPGRVGPYRLTERIGGGGMGAVYRAERADGTFEQQVAVKLLRAELAAGEALRRFLRERQILASLQHPHIARVFDGGVTDRGRPYLVMEYVEGCSIDRHCNEGGCPVEKRIELLRQVADAVQYAHRNLVVHRDLKPSNVLVTPEGEVKLVDFGIAKLLKEEAGAASPRTHTGERWMTPEYAAPEQLAGEAITTATDVYQIGLLAYELLSGRRPFDLRDRPAHEAARIVLEEEPSRPSAELAGEDDSSSALSGRFDTEWRQLRRTLEGDLDRIVLKALRREPERRYASAEALNEDLRRYQAGLPVEARPATPLYRVRKFARRHQFGMAVAVLLVMLGAGYAFSMAGQMRKTARQRDKAERLATFMIDLFEVSDPNEAAGDAVTARDLLDRGAQQARDGLRRQPATQSTFLNVTGNIYRRLGLYGEAEPLLETALSERRHLYDEDAHPDVAESLHALGRLRYAQGRFQDAGRLYRRALAMRRQLYGPQHPDVAATLRAIGQLRQSTGRYAEADSLFREALAMRRKLLDPGDPGVAESLNDVASALRNQGEYQEAERRYRKALRLYRRAFGETHLRVAESLSNVAVVLRGQGEYREAESYARKALQRYRRLFGTEHPDVATSLSSLAYILQLQGRYAEAEKTYRRVLSMRKRLLGEDHPHVAHSLNNLASVLQDQGRYAEAEPLARRALEIYRAAYGNEHPQVAQALTTLAWLKRNEGSLREAEPLFREVVTIRRRLLGDDHPRVGKDLSYLASLLHRRGQYAEADSLFRRALHILHTSVSDDHPYRVIALTGRGDLLTDRGQAEKAELLLRQALAIRWATLPSGHWRTAKTKCALGRCLLAQGRPDEAAPLLKSAHATLEETRGPSDPLTERAAQSLAALEQSGAESTEAETTDLAPSARALLAQQRDRIEKLGD